MQIEAGMGADLDKRGESWKLEGRS